MAVIVVEIIRSRTRKRTTNGGNCDDGDTDHNKDAKDVNDNDADNKSDGTSEVTPMTRTTTT